MIEQLRLNGRKAVAGAALSIGVLGAGATVEATQDCPNYPPAPCNTVPPEETIPTTVPDTVPTTVPERDLPETGSSNTESTLVIAGSTLLAGVAIAGISSISRRRQRSA